MGDQVITQSILRSKGFDPVKRTAIFEGSPSSPPLRVTFNEAWSDFEGIYLGGGIHGEGGSAIRMKPNALVAEKGCATPFPEKKTSD